MVKQTIEGEKKAIVQAVTALGGEASLETVASELSFRLPHRTLQRRAAALVEEQRLIRSGRARASRYRLASAISEGAAAEYAAELPLSSEGDTIRRIIRGPIQNRQPVGYVRAFLDQYRPNRDFYLPETLRENLADMGRSVDATQPAGTHARSIWNRLLIDLSWNSSRLEGNTYSLLETERLLELGETAEGKNAEEAQMILNHKAAISLLVDQAEGIGFNRYTIQNLHALLADNLLADPQAVGRLRHIPVDIDGTVYYPLEVPQLIEECFDQILATVAAINDPFEQAFFVTVHIPYLQPFDDVNKRVSRLAANIPLIRGNFAPLSFVDVPVKTYIDGLLGIYELNRIELLRDVFVWAYERSCARYAAVRRSLGEPDKFRLRHRDLIAATIRKIVTSSLDKQQATSLIRKTAHADLAKPNRARFVEVVETELMGLHEGNMARYKITPTEFSRWQENWA